MNKAIIMGRLGRDPEIKYLDNGKAVCKFSVATDNGKGKDPDWHRVVCWEKTAELAAEYLTKGRQVLVDGRIQYGEYTNKDGNKVYTTDIVANRVEFVGSRGDSQDAKKNDQAGTYTPPSIDDDDVPF